VSFTNPTPSDPSNHVFHHHLPTGQEVIEEMMSHASCLAFGFLGLGLRRESGMSVIFFPCDLKHSRDGHEE
jgi:hypothetical protein